MQHVALTVRKLKPGAYENWRQAWQASGDYPEELKDGYILRKVSDPDEVIAFGIFEGDLQAMRAEMGDEMDRRTEAMAPFIDSIGADGIYEVVERFPG